GVWLGGCWARRSLQCSVFFFQAEGGIRDFHVTGVQTCALPILRAGLIGEATRASQRFGDHDLGFDALAYSGLALVEEGRVSEGKNGRASCRERARIWRGGGSGQPKRPGEARAVGARGRRRAFQW